MPQKNKKANNNPQTAKKNGGLGKIGSDGARLIYPLQLPRGPRKRGDGSISNRATSSTRSMDYLKFSIYDSEKNNPYTYAGQPGKGGGKAKTGTADQIMKSVYLYLPHDLSETFSTTYDKATLGPFGAAVVEAMKNNDMSSIVDKVQAGANAAKPEIAFSAVSGIFNGLNNFAGTDGSLDKNQMAALAKGKVFNPYQETVFKGVNYRSHNFTFDMAPRNEKEAENIIKIIHALRDAMLPGTSGEAARWLTIPRFFKAELIRYNPNGSSKTAKGGGEISRPETLSTLLTYPVNMVLTNMQVNMTPSGQNSSIRGLADDGTDFGPASYRMTLTFDETAFITRDMYKNGGKNK
jgi:hypothetical protein